MTLLYIWLAFLAGFLVGIWWIKGRAAQSEEDADLLAHAHRQGKTAVAGDLLCVCGYGNDGVPHPGCSFCHGTGKRAAFDQYWDERKTANRYRQSLGRGERSNINSIPLDRGGAA